MLSLKIFLVIFVTEHKLLFGIFRFDFIFCGHQLFWLWSLLHIELDLHDNVRSEIRVGHHKQLKLVRSRTRRCLELDVHLLPIDKVGDLDRCRNHPPILLVGQKDPPKLLLGFGKVRTVDWVRLFRSHGLFALTLLALPLQADLFIVGLPVKVIVTFVVVVIVVIFIARLVTVVARRIGDIVIGIRNRVLIIITIVLVVGGGVLSVRLGLVRRLVIIVVIVVVFIVGRGAARRTRRRCDRRLLLPLDRLALLRLGLKVRQRCGLLVLGSLLLVGTHAFFKPKQQLLLRLGRAPAHDDGLPLQLRHQRHKRKCCDLSFLMANLDTV
eukprot:m.51496 g.51496  ORF g.51496 m.51496 type:complete len:325 (-) comp7314_c0_seq1:1413-2387(-)